MVSFVRQGIFLLLLEVLLNLTQFHSHFYNKCHYLFCNQDHDKDNSSKKYDFFLMIVILLSQHQYNFELIRNFL